MKNPLSNLQVILLSLLSEEAMTGYDLNKQTAAYGWSASHQQIYRELNLMESKGYVTFELVPQEGKPDKKVYTVSDCGRDLLSLVAEATSPSVPKWQDEAGAMVFSKHANFFFAYITQLSDEIIRLDQVRDSMLPEARLLLNRRRHHLQADIDWCNQVIEKFTPMSQTA